eukprot:CAMPEP_0201112972 /NCGR_PEP_ID=MMETSP0812-20130820/77569_1 /ASSEMBLY_ACC=CAM_ASM_000668 /TAXON_ID=98059 /ORGANISM="Dinobryon sp., Strain UTEXLB2267" /LENGTH=432 /DNA_ID=CAMNT_0047376421 /DNA_START=1009 /DNA_END=2307 /DNA_ORIENTATION=-
MEHYPPPHLVQRFEQQYSTDKAIIFILIKVFIITIHGEDQHSFQCYQHSNIPHTIVHNHANQFAPVTILFYQLLSAEAHQSICLIYFAVPYQSTSVEVQQLTCLAYFAVSFLLSVGAHQSSFCLTYFAVIPNNMSTQLAMTTTLLNILFTEAQLHYLIYFATTQLIPMQFVLKNNSYVASQHILSSTIMEASYVFTISAAEAQLLLYSKYFAVIHTNLSKRLASIEHNNILVVTQLSLSSVVITKGIAYIALRTSIIISSNILVYILIVSLMSSYPRVIDLVITKGIAYIALRTSIIISSNILVYILIVSVTSSYPRVIGLHHHNFIPQFTTLKRFTNKFNGFLMSVRISFNTFSFVSQHLWFNNNISLTHKLVSSRAMPTVILLKPRTSSSKPFHKSIVYHANASLSTCSSQFIFIILSLDSKWSGILAKG